MRVGEAVDTNWRSARTGPSTTSVMSPGTSHRITAPSRSLSRDLPAFTAASRSFWVPMRWSSIRGLPWSGMEPVGNAGVAELRASLHGILIAESEEGAGRHGICFPDQESFHNVRSQATSARGDDGHGNTLGYEASELQIK